jgi:membrane-bound lytic murein transglycosylase D
MMFKKSFIILVSFLFLYGIGFTTPYQPIPDTTDQDNSLALNNKNNLPVNDTAALNLLVANELKRSIIGDMLDSLVNIKFFTNSSFPEDTGILNVNLYPAGFVPVFSDSVLEARIEELKKNSAIELTYNKNVKAFIELYAIKKRQLAAKILGLAEVYFPFFEEQLDKYNMPLELKYLAVVESALNPTATSRAGAKGLWQFMYNTGKLYGLKANSLIDDRYDPYKATDAACRHMKDLYTIYGDWNLVMAAYNSGAGNVNKAIRRAGGVKNYWAIWPYLPSETRGYVPAFIAVMYLMNYPSEHNLYPMRPTILFEEIDTVMVSDVLSFDQISEFLKIPRDEVEFLNPAYKTGIIPSGKDKKYVLRLQQKYIGAFIENEQDLYAYKTTSGIEKEKLLVEVKKAKEQDIHIVRSGESLGLIANKYHCSVASLKSWNNLKNNTIRPGQKLYVLSPGKSTSTISKTIDQKPKEIVQVSKDPNIHIVADGETLASISQKKNCKVDDLKKWNNLKDDTIHPEQKLVVTAPKEEIALSEKQPEKQPEKKFINDEYIYHIVRRGDTLWDIARQYDGVTVEQIKKLNNISNSKSLKPGQKLKVSQKG